jgi:stearoyl-CoA desaturase (delta-9 desaturase)
MASAVAMRWGHGVGLADVLLAVTLYMVTGFGIAAGFHRLITQLHSELFPEFRK